MSHKGLQSLPDVLQHPVDLFTEPHFRVLNYLLYLNKTCFKYLQHLLFFNLFKYFRNVTATGYHPWLCVTVNHKPSANNTMERKRAYQTNMKQRFDRCKTPMGSVPISVIMGFDYPLGVKCLVKPKYRSNENLVTRVRLGDGRPRRAPPPPPLHRPRQPQQVAQH